MVFKKNGNGNIETNWKTLAAIFTCLSVIISIVTTTINIGIGIGAIKKDIAIIRDEVNSLKCEVRTMIERIPIMSTRLDEHERRLNKLDN